MLLAAFVAATLAWAALALYLSLRQAAHVARHREAVPADFAATIPLADHRKAADYTVARERLARVETLVEAALALAWALGGIAALDRLIGAALPEGIARGTLFLLAAGAIGALASLPVAVYRKFVLEARFGFNRSTPATFAADMARRAAIGLLLNAPLAAAALWAMGRFTGLWWLWAWFGVLALMVAAPAVYVRLIAPRFNTFTPLPEGALREGIERLLARAGFRSSGLYVMDASRRTTQGNAYFIGFGRAKRIVLFDTLVERSGEREIEAVIAHELGHFRHGHVWLGLAQGAALAFVALAGFGWLCRQPWLLPSFGLAAGGDAVRLYVCLLLAGAVGPLLAPLVNWLSRRHEFQADDFARRQVGAGPMIGALTGLARDNAATLTPDPLFALAHYSHPPVPLRVRHLREAEAA